MTWIFGYGSLMWRPAFAFEARCRAQARGWQRRFWQASPDHRGVPEAPGRVVTLVQDAEAVCWGIAYRPPAARWEAITAALDLREKNGYRRVEVELEFDDGGRQKALSYVAGPDNPSFIGPAPVSRMVAQIAAARGPSGANLEYLLELAETLDRLGVHDPEVDALRAAVLALRARSPAMGGGRTRVEPGPVDRTR